MLLEQVWRADAPPVTNVVEALYRMAGQLEHAMNVLGARVNTTNLDGPDAVAWSRIIREQRQLLAEVARLNIEDRVVELEQKRANMVTLALQLALEAVELAPKARATFVRTFLDHLRVAVAAGPGEVVRGELQ